MKPHEFTSMDDDYDDDEALKDQVNYQDFIYLTLDVIFLTNQSYTKHSKYSNDYNPRTHTLLKHSTSFYNTK